MRVRQFTNAFYETNKYPHMHTFSKYICKYFQMHL